MGPITPAGYANKLGRDCGPHLIDCAFHNMDAIVTTTGGFALNMTLDCVIEGVLIGI